MSPAQPRTRLALDRSGGPRAPPSRAQGPYLPGCKQQESHCLVHEPSFGGCLLSTCYAPDLVFGLQKVTGGGSYSLHPQTESGRKDRLRSRQLHMLLCGPHQPRRRFLKKKLKIKDKKDLLPCFKHFQDLPSWNKIQSPCQARGWWAGGGSWLASPSPSSLGSGRLARGQI